MVNSLSGHKQPSQALQFSKFTNFKNRVICLIGKIVQSAFPKTWFCWTSRSWIQFQARLRPKKYPYWSKLSNQIYLGAIPLKNYHHLEKISALGIKAVLSINKKYEFQSQLFAKPVKPSDWQSKKIAFLRVASPDLQPLKTAKITQAVDYISDQVKLGNPVYIHCTAGRGLASL